ncbi:ATP-grasp domain-containing protein [Micromonospora echinospora]|uniref:ATP-grasp domain-containing protein n=1 Tax=Micromonospora echinospora TaxID=1877 RepID=UPI0033E2C832
MKRPVGVVVDAYTTGNLLPAAFAAHGVDLVHVQAAEQMHDALPGPDLTAFVDNIVFSGDALPRLRALDPICVVAGQDSGVALADRLSEQLGLPTNGSASSPLRRDKYRMVEQLRTDGLRCARQFRAADPADLVCWIKENTTYPVVVKPVRSAGTDRVRMCHDDAAVEAAARAVLAAPDVYGAANTDVLVQSYLPGEEYIVDTVSRDGRRFVCGVWRYHKRLVADGRPVYDRDVLLDPSEQPVPELIAYVDDVLASLGVRHGSAHAEVIVTPDGPALVEIGARMNGNMNPGFHDVCLGHNQASLTALAYVDPERFHARHAGRVYSPTRPAMVCNTSTDRAGLVASVDDGVLARIAALPTVHAVAVKLRPGDLMRPTRDLLTSPLRIFLTGDGMAEDYAVIQDLKDEVFRLR